MLINKICSLAIGATAIASTGVVVSYLSSSNKPERATVIKKYNLDKYGSVDWKIDLNEGWYIDLE